MNEDNLISTLEHSLRQFQQAEQKLQERLRRVEEEAEFLKVEIEALQTSAEKAEEALQSLLPRMRSGSKSWKTHRKATHEEENEYQKKPRYEGDDEYQKKPRYEEDDYQKLPRYDDEYQKKARYEEDDYQMPPDSRRYSRPTNVNQPPENYRNNPVSYLNNPKNVAPINRNYEIRSNRFAERTITQACTLIFREALRPLHVDDLFHLLVEGGFKFTGNNPKISIAVSLNRNRGFRKVAPGTFDLLLRDMSSKTGS